MKAKIPRSTEAKRQSRRWAAAERKDDPAEDVDLFLLLGPSFIKMHQNSTPGPSKTVSGLKDLQYGQQMHFNPD